jgi:hypothetical protein
MLIQYRNKLKKKNYFIINQIKKKNSIKLSKILISKTFKKKLTNFTLNCYWNQNFDKNRLKIFVFWCFKNYGQNKTIKVLEILKHLGFQYATKAGLSLSIDDLIIPPTKSKLLIEAELTTRTATLQYKNAQITNLERFQKIIETWHITSEKMKDDLISHFKTTNIFNPLYMMAFSGARGNISQVRQLVGMRGLMANPQGQILDFPIQSNFREGLTLTEYVISCYGARKGVVDTALRTANAGYLTRRLVDVAQHVIISNFDCGTNRGLIISEMKQGNKLLFSLRQRLLGRVLAKDIKSGNLLIAKKNQEISDNLSEIIVSIVKTVIIRSPLTCKTTQFICQLCYGWSLAEGKLVGVGETVGIIAAQSIGEPGTQLTMRTFHTGGVFAGELLDQLIAPFDGIIKYNIYIPGNMIRTPQGKIAFLTRIESQFFIENCSNLNNKKYYTIPPYTILFIRNRETVSKDQLIAQLCSFSPSLKNSSNLIEYKIYSDLEGEIKSTNLRLLKKVTEMNDIMNQSLEWGYIWILSGRIYQLPFNSIDILKLRSVLQQKNNLFPIKGDFLTKSSILSEIIWINNYENIRIIFEQKTIFYHKFINNKKIYLKNYNQTQWLNKWQKSSEMPSLKSLNQSITNFNFKKNFPTENSFLNIYSQNFLLFLTIDKIRYKKLGYFLFFKNNLKNTYLKKIKKNNSLKNIQNKTKQNKDIVLNSYSTQKTFFNNYIFENKFFIPISLESNSFINQENSLLTSPRFFYQKISHRFFEWFPNEGNKIGPGLIKLSEIFLFKNQLKKEISKNNQIKKKQQKNIKLQSYSFTNIKHKNKKLFHSQQLNKKNEFDYYPTTRYFRQKSFFLNQYNNEKKIKYLNHNYSFIFFNYRPLNDCEKQQLSQFHYIHNTYNCVDHLIKSTILPLKKININMKNTKCYCRCANAKIFNLKKQLINNKILKKRIKYQSKNFFRLISNNIKKDQIINLKKNNRSKLISVIKLRIHTKFGISNLNNTYILNKTKKSLLQTYTSLNPIALFYKISILLKKNLLLLKKKFYNKLQLITFLENHIHFHCNYQIRYDYFFTIFNTNYLTKKNFIHFHHNEMNTYNCIDKIQLYRFYIYNFIDSFVKKISNIFISFNNTYNCIDINRKTNLFSYKYILYQFYYINWNHVVYKHKMFRELKNNFNKSKENLNIKTLKKFHSSFTYYIIKNQFRFAPSFQKQSINEHIQLYRYKKEIHNLSDFNIYKKKLLFFKQLTNTYNCIGLIKELSLNIFKKQDIHNIHLVKLDTYNFIDMFEKINIQMLINQIEKTKKNLENKRMWDKNFKKIYYVKILLKQFIKLSNYFFYKKRQKLIFLKNYDYKQQNIEKKLFRNCTIINSIYYKKSVPILLIKYKKIEINLDTKSFHDISIFNNFLIRKPSINRNQKFTRINTKKNHSIYNLKIYLIKLNSLNNIVLNSYFQFISFKWLKLKKEISLTKKKIFNPIFLKRLKISKFINNNLMISHDKPEINVLNLLVKLNLFQEYANKQTKNLNNTSKNEISKGSEERFLLYSRFFLVPKEYSKVYKKQLSLLFFNTQQTYNCIDPTFYKEIPFYFLLNSNNLALFHKSLFFNNVVYNRKIKLKKTVKLLTLKNFLNFRKTENNLNILSKNNYLQKINKFLFNLFKNVFNFNKELQLFSNNRQGKYIPLKFNNYYGILKINQKTPIIKSLGQKSFLNKNFFNLSKKSKILLNKKFELYQNKKEFILTSQHGWICKPIRNLKIEYNYSNLLSNYHFHLINKLLRKHLNFYNKNYINSFESISIYYKFCEKNLIWLNYTFLEMLELVQNFLKKYYRIGHIHLYNEFCSLTFFDYSSNYLQYDQNLKIKTKKENFKKINKYYWLINQKSRFLKMKKSNMFFFIQNGTNNIDNVFFIVKIHEFIINNYQNLSYLSNTNLLLLSKKKLFKMSEKKYQPNRWRESNGLILKYQYHSTLLNKQKISQKLISKFPNLETTFEQYLGIPLNKITTKKKNFKFSYDSNKFYCMCERVFINNKNARYDTMCVKKYLKKIQKQINSFNRKNYKIFKSQKSVNIFRFFLGFSIPITFDFSFQSSHISWNYFPNSNLSNLKFDKKRKSTIFINYLIFKNQKLNILKNATHVPLYVNSTVSIINILNCIKMLLRQPCIDWSATQQINLGYKKNLSLTTTKTLLLLSPENSLSSNNPIALTKIYSSMKGEILYSFKNKKQNSNFSHSIEPAFQIAEKLNFNNFLEKSDRSLFLTKSDQICFKFQNEINIHNELNYFQKFNIFKNNKHIRGLKIFQIKSSKQIILIFKILQKIHNSCQFSNQLIKIDLGLFIFQGDFLNTFFRNSNIENIIKNKKTIKIKKNNTIIVNHSGQIIHLNQKKLTLRKGQPIFFSPHCIFHSYNNDFIEQNKPVLSLPYQQLKTGDIVQGIPKIEQLFEARLTFAGKLEYDNLTNILEIIFQTYKNKLTLKLAVRRSIELVQMIIVNSIQRIYRSQGVNISDKHLEVIVKQMTKKVEIIDSGQSGFLIGEHFDLDVVELWNSKLSKIKHVKYKPLILVPTN